MAVIGKTGSYATVQPLVDTIGGALQDVENRERFKAQQEEQKRLLKERQDQEKLAEIDKINQSYGTVITGNQSVDDMTFRFASESREKDEELWKQEQMAKTIDEKTTIRQKRNKLRNNYASFAQTPKMIQEKIKELEEGVRNNKYNQRDVDLILSQLKALDSGKGRLYLDDNANMVIDLYDVDEEKKIKGVLVKGQNLSAFVAGLTPNLAPKYDSAIADITSKYKIDVEKIQKGSITETKQLIGDKEITSAENFANTMLAIPSEVYELSNRYNTNDPEKLKEIIKNDFLGRLQQKYEKDIDVAFLSHQFRVSQANKKEQEKKAALNVYEVQGDLVGKNAPGFKQVSVSGTQPVVQTLKMPDGTILNGATLQNWTVDGNNRVVGDISVVKYKNAYFQKPENQKRLTLAQAKQASGEELTNDDELILQKATESMVRERVVVPLTDAVADKFATQMGYKNASQMKAKAGRLEKEEKPKETAKERAARIAAGG